MIEKITNDYLLHCHVISFILIRQINHLTKIFKSFSFRSIHLLDLYYIFCCKQLKSEASLNKIIKKTQN